MPQSSSSTCNIKPGVATVGTGKVGNLTEYQDLKVLRSRRQKPERSFLEAFFCQEIQASTGDIPTRAPDRLLGWGEEGTKAGLFQDACSMRPLVPGWAEREGGESSQSVLDGPLQGQASVL